MSVAERAGELNKQQDTSDKDCTKARCLICGRTIEDNEDVMPIVCIEAGEHAYQCVVCDLCVTDFDERVLVELFVLQFPSDGGMVC